MRRYIPAIILLVSMFHPPALPAAEQAKSRPSVVNQGFPALVESIRFKGRIHLCGHDIPHQIPEVRERLEKEMLLAVWNRPQVILWLKRAGRYFPHIEKF